MDRKFAPQFPKLAYAEGPKCGHWQHRANRVSLRCVRAPHGPEVNHLHDVDPRYMLTEAELAAKVAESARIEAEFKAAVAAIVASRQTEDQFLAEMGVEA